MALCPNCQISIEIGSEHFGSLFRCPNCKAEFFVGFDGVPENSKEPALVDDPVVDSTQPVDESLGMGTTDQLNPSYDMYSILNSNASEPIKINDDNPTSENFDSQKVNDINQSTRTADIVQDIQDYANSTANSLTFDLVITGFDLAEQRDVLLEILADKKFNWDLENIKSLIALGKLELKNVAPAKSVILIKRLLSAGIEINWSQNVEI